MKTIFGVVTAIVLSLCFFVAHSQGTSNKGTEFWTAYGDHNSGATGNTGSSMILYITSDISTTGSVEVADGTFTQPFTVTANQVKFVTIPASAFLGNNTGTITPVKKGIHITSINPIAVYAHIYASSVSGATLLFPVNAMGKNYVSLNYTQNSNAPTTDNSFFIVIGTEDNTTVSITPASALKNGKAAGVAFPITLNKGEIYQGLSDNDLTGTKIQSISTVAGVCKKIAVFSGANKIGIGCGGGGTSDNLFQQVYPVSAWGKNYIAAPLKSRPFDIYRIVLSDPTITTNVTLNGTLLSSNLFTNGYYEFQSTSTNVISADKPIQVVQYTGSQGCSTNNTDLGDPEMIYLSPIEQGLDQVTLYSTGYFSIQKSYINVVIPTTAVSSFTLDGVAYTNFSPVSGNTAYSYAQIPVSSGPTSTGGGSITSGTHTIKASEPFNAIAYGFGNVESYGYAAGTNLKDLSEYVQFKNPQNSNVQTAGCVGVDYKLQVTLPYPTTNISWKVDGVVTSTVANPTAVSQQQQGTKTLYTYEYPGLVNYTVGTHIIIAKVFNPVADDCGNDVEIGYNFEVTSPPTIDFTVAANTCLGEATVFKDTSTPTGSSTVKAWLWDFGDGQTSILQNPGHVYSASGDYTVVLTITDSNGCTNVITKTTHVAVQPVSKFTLSTPNCDGQPVTFTNTSTSVDGNIVSWLWDYGDGNTLAATNGQSIQHTYAAPGNYTATLIVVTDRGCSSTVTTQVKINPMPIVDFTLPDVCLALLGDISKFKDISTFAAGVTAQSWLWNFGDGETSNLQNPGHVYAAPGNYTVSLTVTDINGCTKVATKTTGVAIQPVAKFTQSTPNCDGQPVTFTNMSTSSDGNIISWLWDYGDGNTLVATNGQPIQHIYTAPGSYIATLTVLTGKGCSSTVTTQVKINLMPVADFTLPDVCLADASAQFTDKTTITDNSAFTYLWNFGDQNSTAANKTSTLKNPQHKYSAAGYYTVTLTVTSVSGCVSVKNQTITVNGSTPKAAFSFPTNICSSDDVVFTDISTVDFGGITKIIWYYDYINHPTDAETYTTANMPADKKFHHSYGLFNAPLQQNYQVKIVVYSGQTCFSTITHTVTVNANPIVTLNPASLITLCQSDSPLQIAENTNGFVGTGVFTGTGISSTGLFDPTKSGTGTFAISYLFTTATTGCTYATTLQVKVNPTPVIIVTADMQLLEGGQVTLSPTATVATGTLTYKWTPSTGLSSDNVLTPIASPTDFTTYTLTATSDKGCIAVARINVNVLKAPVVNNTFTPNGDGINDTWVIKYLDSYTKATVQIFNRLGETVFSSNGYPVAWDGRYRGADLPAGVYYYIINPNSGRKPIAGYISIVR